MSRPSRHGTFWPCWWGGRACSFASLTQWSGSLTRNFLVKRSPPSSNPRSRSRGCPKVHGRKSMGKRPGGCLTRTRQKPSLFSAQGGLTSSHFRQEASAGRQKSGNRPPWWADENWGNLLCPPDSQKHQSL